MDWHRIVNSSLYSVIMQALQDMIPACNPDHVQMPDVLIARQNLWQANLIKVGQQLGIPQRRLSAGRVPLGQPPAT